MKRTRVTIAQVTAEENLLCALAVVNGSHRRERNHRLNKTVLRIESDPAAAIKALREILTHPDTYYPTKPRVRARWDANALKWRDIAEQPIWPDQYIYHAVIQVLQPTMMRGMDKYCCASIKGRGTGYGRKHLERWLRRDRKHTRYAGEGDIHHFYESLQPAVVMKRLRRLFKGREVLTICEHMMRYGVIAGAFFSQWFANTTLQELDRMIREDGAAHYYTRHMDNLTILGSNKRKLHRLFRRIEQWLRSHELQLKGNWQIFPLRGSRRARTVCAFGYRYQHGMTRLRKAKQLCIRRQARSYLRRRGRVSAHFAASLLSRLGMLKHCRHTRFYAAYIPDHLQRRLKDIVRQRARKEREKWIRNTSLAMTATP